MLWKTNALTIFEISFSKHSLISYEQHGFRPKTFLHHGCKNIGLACFVESSKVFDTVNHDILLLKLEHYDIGGNGLYWFKDFLMDQKQYVATILGSPDFRNFHCGVPQISVLGPLLFLLYIKGLPSRSNSSNVLLFVDDTTVISHRELLMSKSF